MFKTREGGGGKWPFKKCLKKLHNWYGMASLIIVIVFVKSCPILKLILAPVGKRVSSLSHFKLKFFDAKNKIFK